MTKHEALINYILELPIGTKISVRQTAKNLSVSQGTAYRAIKDAERRGYVSTVPKVGTIRIKIDQNDYQKNLTFSELNRIVNGSVLGGRQGLYKTLDKFVIGAMELQDMESYIREGCVLIVGNREKAHELALQKGASVLISGGFSSSEDNIKLADEYSLPIIQSPYDTYRIAFLINRALHNKAIEADILQVKDIMNEDVHFLEEQHTYQDWRALVDKTKHSRFPVVNNEGKIIGMVTSKDVTGEELATPVTEVMTDNPITVSRDTLIASIAHVMVWEGIELIPVVEGEYLIGVVTRQDVMKALQFGKKGDSSAGAIKERLLHNFKTDKFLAGATLRGRVSSAMTNQMGSMDTSHLVNLVMLASYAALRAEDFHHIVLENYTFHYLGPIQLDQDIEVNARILESSKTHGKIDIDITEKDRYLLKAYLSCQILNK